MNVQKIKSKKGLWIFTVPVSGLVLTDAINNEITINKITFISQNRLSRVRKRLGFPVTIAELVNTRSSIFGNFFNNAKTFAVCKLGGTALEREQQFLDLVRDELNILSLSQLGYGRRRINAALTVSNEIRSGSLKYLMLHSKNKSWSLQHKISGRFMELALDDDWKEYQKFSYFYELIALMKGEYQVSSGWRRDIINAALLCGQSQSSSNLPQAFLWNMIAIETLLTHQGDSYSTALPKRVEAFIGWTTNWSVSNYEEKISEVYKKRCAFVHAGMAEQISIEDLLFTDVLLVNIFYNILKHLDIFSCKESLIEFSNKVEAEHLLGIKPRVRPKTMHFINMRYSEKDYEGI